jgi:hypothetical protein
MALSLIPVGRSEKRLTAQNNRESVVVLHGEIECFITSRKGGEYLQVTGGRKVTRKIFLSHQDGEKCVSVCCGYINK